MSGIMPDNLPACFFAPRETFRVTLRTAFRVVAAVPGFARLARDLAAVDLAAVDLPRDLAAAERRLAVLAFGFTRDLAAAGFVRRDAAPLRRVAAALVRRDAVAPALRTAVALRAG